MQSVFQIKNTLQRDFSLLLIIPGGYRVEATPVPISNTAVKLHIADGTAGYPWESRSLPGFFELIYIFILFFLEQRSSGLGSF